MLSLLPRPTGISSFDSLRALREIEAGIGEIGRRIGQDNLLDGHLWLWDEVAGVESFGGGTEPATSRPIAGILKPADGIR